MNISILGTTSIKQEDTYYSPEELIAMLMQHAKDMSYSQGGKVRYTTCKYRFLCVVLCCVLILFDFICFVM